LATTFRSRVGCVTERDISASDWLFDDAPGRRFLFGDYFLHQHPPAARLLARWAWRCAWFAAIVLADVPRARTFRQAVPFFFALVDDLRDLLFVGYRLADFAIRVPLRGLGAAGIARGFVAAVVAEQLTGGANLKSCQARRDGRENSTQI